MRFKRKRGGSVEASVDDVEAEVLGRCASDLVTLLGADEPEGEDPLAALVGLSSGEPERPRDPALARLLPDAYGDDEGASREFRRYTDRDLRTGKRAAAATFLATLPGPDGGVVRLDRDQADAWLGVLNDLRLVLGTRLEVTEDLDPDDLAEDDPRLQALHLYGWLGWLQESLLSCLSPRQA